MDEKPHSREWYACLAQRLEGYRHPWQRTLDAPDPELIFDALLMMHLNPDTRVLEAGCGHGPDALRFGPLCAHWTGYDFVPDLVDMARKNAPQAEFHLWDGKQAVPPRLTGPFDLIVSRRGPTSVIPHLPAVAATNARFLYIGPRLDVPQVPTRLEQVGWERVSESRVSVQAHAATWEDWQVRCEFMGEKVRREDWDRLSTERGIPYREERYVVLAAPAVISDHASQ